MQGALPRRPVMAAARGLAPGLRWGRLDGDEVRPPRLGGAYEGYEGGLEEGGADAVHENGEPAPARRAVLERPIAAQETGMRLAPFGNLA